MSLTITPLSAALGAQIDGVDLTLPLSLEHRDAIEQALLKHQVIFFKQQSITPTQQARFAANFGDLHIHPIYPNVPETPQVLILDTAVTDVRDNAVWHTDVTFLPTPALGAVLSAKQLPAYGGDTLWASGIAAFEALSAPLRAMLDGLTATHDDIVRRLAVLSPRERAIVVSRFYFDHAEKDVAIEFGVSVGTVKSTCSRALAKMRAVGGPARGGGSR